MKNRKLFTFICGIVFLAIVFSGCSKPQNEYINLNDSSSQGSQDKKTPDPNSTANKTVTFYTDDVKKDGYIVAISQAAMEKVGYKVNVEYMPWARASQEVITDGTHNAIIGPGYTEERAKTIIFTEPVTTYHTMLFALKGKEITYSKYEDLKSYTIGMIKAQAINTEFDGASYLKKEIGDTPEANIKKLLAGRIDLLIDNKEALEGEVKAGFPNDVGKLVAIEPPLLEKKIYCGFSKKFPESEQMTKDFNSGLKIITDDGTVKKLMEQYSHP
jgi:polar amino acid transport system substrate-binding protein